MLLPFLDLYVSTYQKEGFAHHRSDASTSWGGWRYSTRAMYFIRRGVDSGTFALMGDEGDSVIGRVLYSTLEMAL